MHSINKKTINQFIREVRLHKAMDLLQNESFSVSEVSYKVGFGSPAYFNTCFREYFGFPPGQIRNNGFRGTEQNTINPIIEKQDQNKDLRKNLILKLFPIFFIAVLILIVAYFFYPKILTQDPLKRLRSSGEKASVAVMPLRGYD